MTVLRYTPRGALRTRRYREEAYLGQTMDRIIISDILVRCIVGVRKEERREKQDVTINIVLTADLRQAGETDRLEDSIDYSALKKRVVAMAEESRFHLIEALAERIARICLEHPRVVEAQVRVEKPTALRYARSVGVDITRSRTG